MIPICWDCWREVEPFVIPPTVADRRGEDCGFCGEPTGSGIYVPDPIAMLGVLVGSPGRPSPRWRRVLGLRSNRRGKETRT